MKQYIFSSLLLVALAAPAHATDASDDTTEALISTQSALSVEETADKLEAMMKEKGLTVFARINHAVNAEKVDLHLRPTELIIFGNPKVGTPLMQCSQTIAIDLPQKMLVWQDKEGKSWLSYNNPDALRERHNVEGCGETLAKVKKVLGGLSAAVAAE